MNQGLSVYWICFILIGILFVGAYGFRSIAGLDWLDSFHNASMYTAGMGPLFEMKTPQQKVFSSVYTLVAGMVFIGICAALLHRIIIRFPGILE